MLSYCNDKSSDFGDPSIDLLDAKAILSCYYGDTFHDTSINCLELKTHTVAKHKKRGRVSCPSCAPIFCSANHSPVYCQT